MSLEGLLKVRLAQDHCSL